MEGENGLQRCGGEAHFHMVRSWICWITARSIWKQLKQLPTRCLLEAQERSRRPFLALCARQLNGRLSPHRGAPSSYNTHPKHCRLPLFDLNPPLNKTDQAGSNPVSDSKIGMRVTALPCSATQQILCKGKWSTKLGSPPIKPRRIIFRSSKSQDFPVNVQSA